MDQFMLIIGSAIILGPLSVPLAVIKAGEVGKDVTEEDLLASHRVSEIMDSEPRVLMNNSSLKQMLQTAAESDALFYPVVDETSRPIGMISLLEIEDMFTMEGLENLVLACDLMTDIQAVTIPEARLADALEKMKAVDVEILPVVNTYRDHHLVGMLEQRRIQQILAREIFRTTREEI